MVVKERASTVGEPPFQHMGRLRLAPHCRTVLGWAAWASRLWRHSSDPGRRVHGVKACRARARRKDPSRRSLRPNPSPSAHRPLALPAPPSRPAHPLYRLEVREACGIRRSSAVPISVPASRGATTARQHPASPTLVASTPIFADASAGTDPSGADRYESLIIGAGKRTLIQYPQRRFPDVSTFTLDRQLLHAELVDA